MIASTQIRKPENWQDFEKLCKKLWGEIWNCPDTIKRNGRLGQHQNGVDIYGIPQGESQYFGIQCKGKDDYTNSTLTEKEIEEEIQKAKAFKPALKRFVFATTANKNVGIEEYVREKDIECRANGLFEVYLACWEDIVDLLEDNRNTFNWYINNCQYKDNTDINVTFKGQNEMTICPEYYRTIVKYEMVDCHKKSIISDYSLSMLGFINNIKDPNCLGKNNISNTQWCEIPVKIENIGATVIEDFKLYFRTKEEYVEKIDSGIEYMTDIRLSPSFRMEMNRRIDEEREVFESTESCNELVYIPNNSVLVQKDRRCFTFKIGLKYGVTEIPIFWDFKSRDYHKGGVLTIIVNPQIEERVRTQRVYNFDRKKQTEVIIEPKIVENNDKEVIPY